MKQRLLGGAFVAVVLAGGMVTQAYSLICDYIPWALECWIFGY